MQVVVGLLAFFWGGMQLFMIWAKSGVYPCEEAWGLLILGILLVYAGILLLRRHKNSWYWFVGAVVLFLIQLGPYVFCQKS